LFRQELAKEMANNIEALKVVDLSEFNEHLDKDAELFEEKFIKLFSNDECEGPKCPVFDFTPSV